MTKQWKLFHFHNNNEGSNIFKKASKNTLVDQRTLYLCYGIRCYKLSCHLVIKHPISISISISKKKPKHLLDESTSKLHP